MEWEKAAEQTVEMHKTLLKRMVRRYKPDLFANNEDDEEDDEDNDD